jgi:hypothetical protein
MIQTTAMSNKMLCVSASVSYAYISYIVVGVIALCLLLLALLVICLCGCEACGCAQGCCGPAKKAKKKSRPGEPDSPIRFDICQYLYVHTE